MSCRRVRGDATPSPFRESSERTTVLRRRATFALARERCPGPRGRAPEELKKPPSVEACQTCHVRRRAAVLSRMTLRAPDVGSVG